MPRRYPPEFRRKVLDLLKSGCTVADVASGLGVTAQIIYNLLGPGAHRYRSEAGAELDRERRTRRCSSSYRRVGDRACHRHALHGIAEVGGGRKRRFEAIEVMAKEGLPVQTSCRILEVSESGFYEWRNRPPSERSLRHAWWTRLIAEVHTASHGTYGARRVHGRTHPGSRHCSGARLHRNVDESCWCERTSGKQTCTVKASDSDRNRSRGPHVHSRRTEQAVGHGHYRTSHPLDSSNRRNTYWKVLQWLAKSTRISRRKNSSDYSIEVARSAPQRVQSAFMKTQATTGCGRQG